MAGPLKGIRIIEFAGIGPGPFCAMMLADMGADVLRVQRPVVTPKPIPPNPVSGRGMRSITLDLKSAAGRDAVLRIVQDCDALIEGYRPGVMERLGLGPEACMARNGRLVYGRMTGWGQHGPMARQAGHDINYISLTGALAAIGTAESGPAPNSTRATRGAFIVRREKFIRTAGPRPDQSGRRATTARGTRVPRPWRRAGPRRHRSADRWVAR